MQLASELDRRRVLQIVRENLHPPRRVFVVKGKRQTKYPSLNRVSVDVHDAPSPVVLGRVIPRRTPSGSPRWSEDRSCRALHR